MCLLSRENLKNGYLFLDFLETKKLKFLERIIMHSDSARLMMNGIWLTNRARYNNYGESCISIDFLVYGGNSDDYFKTIEQVSVTT